LRLCGRLQGADRTRRIPNELIEALTQPRAKQATDYFALRVRCEIGGLAALLEELDVWCFVAGSARTPA
jgi:acetate kinase